MDNSNIAWVAGIFEGEGTFSSPGRGNTFALTVRMTDEDVIRALADRSGYGRVNGPYLDPRGDNRKPIYMWSVSVSEDAYRLFESMKPWLGRRRIATGDKYLHAYLLKRNETHDQAFDKRYSIIDSCWVWNGPDNSGRPFFQHKGLRMQGQDFSYRRHVDPYFKGRLKVTCGDLMCVNPDHLSPKRADF